MSQPGEMINYQTFFGKNILIHVANAMDLVQQFWYIFRVLQKDVRLSIRNSKTKRRRLQTICERQGF